jgi:uncharacterized protein (DUF433 family)
MVLAANQSATIVRTERGLTIAGTRITLYDVMDYVTAQYPHQFIRSMLNLSDEQVDEALAYITANRAEVEAEYQLVLQETEALRQYYEVENSERMARIAAKPIDPSTAAIRAKLQAERARLESQA